MEKSPVIYKIARYGLACPQEYEISQNEFEIISAAKDRILQVLSIESSFSMMLMAYEDFESFSYRNALHWGVFRFSGYAESCQARLEAGFRAINFLNSSTAYWERALSFGRDLEGPKGKIPMLIENLRALSLAFDLLWFFRVYAQHVDSPVHSSSMNHGWDDERKNQEVTWGWFVNLDAICESQNRKVKQTRRYEFKENFGEKCEISKLFREALNDIGGIHKELRRAMNESFDDSCAIIMGVLDNLKKEGDSLPSARLIREKDGEIDVSIDLFDELIDRAKELRRVRIPVNMHIRHFSSRTIDARV